MTSAIASGMATATGYSLRQTLSTFKANSPIFPNNFGVCIKLLDNTPLRAAFQRLVENKIQAAPIVHNTTGQAIGLLSLKDLVLHLLSYFTKEDLHSNNFTNLIMSKDLFNQQTVMDVKSRTEALVTIKESQTILEAAEEMIKKSVHRVLVLDEHNKPSNLITQSRVLKLAAVNMDSIPGAHKTLREVPIGAKSVVVVNKNEHVRHAFDIIKDNNINAIGVVDDKGVLIGSLSTSDIKFLGYDVRFFKLLSNTVESYLNGIRIYDKYRTIPSDRDPITCTQDASLASVLNTLLYYGIHHMYIVDVEGKPIGIVSLQDILTEFIKESTTSAV
jgi:CBS domain-containing protein